MLLDARAMPMRAAAALICHVDVIRMSLLLLAAMLFRRRFVSFADAVFVIDA